MPTATVQRISMVNPGHNANILSSVKSTDDVDLDNASWDKSKKEFEVQTPLGPFLTEALPAGDLQDFYRAITDSEENHYQLFIALAHQYFAADVVNERLDTLLDAEASITADLIISAALH